MIFLFPLYYSSIMIKIIKSSSFHLSVCHNIITVSILISKLTNCHRCSRFPLVHWRTTSLLLLPFSIQQKCLMGIRLLSYPQFLLKNWIVFALWILWMVNSCHSMRMAATDKSVHSLFLKTINWLNHMRFILAC